MMNKPEILMMVATGVLSVAVLIQALVPNLYPIPLFLAGLAILIGSKAFANPFASWMSGGTNRQRIIKAIVIGSIGTILLSEAPLGEAPYFNYSVFAPLVVAIMIPLYVKLDRKTAVGVGGFMGFIFFLFRVGVVFYTNKFAEYGGYSSMLIAFVLSLMAGVLGALIGQWHRKRAR